MRLGGVVVISIMVFGACVARAQTGAPRTVSVDANLTESPVVTSLPNTRAITAVRDVLGVARNECGGRTSARPLLTLSLTGPMP